METNMLIIIDTCHSGNITTFHYVYDPVYKNMRLTHDPPNYSYPFPLCICLSATRDSSVAPSTYNGSTFTRWIYSIFKKNDNSITIEDMYNKIYENLPILLHDSYPTITSTRDDASIYLPLLKDKTIYECKKCQIIL